jgi:hypothetical protein
LEGVRFRSLDHLHGHRGLDARFGQDGCLGFSRRLSNFNGLGSGKIFLQLIHRLRKLRESAAGWQFEGAQLGLDILLVIGQFGCEIDELAGEHPAGPTGRGENQCYNEQHRADASKPSLQPRNERREKKG